MSNGYIVAAEADIAAVREIADGLGLLDGLTSKHKQKSNEALKYWCLAVLNMNEFIYLD